MKAAGSYRHDLWLDLHTNHETTNRPLAAACARQRCSRGPNARDLHAAYELEKSSLAKLEQERAEAESDFNTSKQYRQRMRKNGLYTEDELARLEKKLSKRPMNGGRSSIGRSKSSGR